MLEMAVLSEKQQQQQQKQQQQQQQQQQQPWGSTVLIQFVQCTHVYVALYFLNIYDTNCIENATWKCKNLTISNLLF